MVEIKIIMGENGAVQVMGPIENKVLCLGLLEMAKQAVINYVPSPIVKPNLVMMPVKE